MKSDKARKVTSREYIMKLIYQIEMNKEDIENIEERLDIFLNDNLEYIINRYEELRLQYSNNPNIELDNIELDDAVDREYMNIICKNLKENNLVILPRETVYGIAANAFSDDACKKIFEVKGRAQDNPLIVHVSDKNMIYDIAEMPNEIEEKLIDSFMPGPFTLILNKKSCICDTVTCFRKNSWHKNA